MANDEDRYVGDVFKDKDGIHHLTHEVGSKTVCGMPINTKDQDEFFEDMYVVKGVLYGGKYGFEMDQPHKTCTTCIMSPQTLCAGT